MLGGGQKLEAPATLQKDVQYLSELIRPIVGPSAETKSSELIEIHSSPKALLSKVSEAKSAPDGLDEPLFNYLRTVAGFLTYVLEREVLNAPVLSNSKALHDYLYNSASSIEREQFRVLYLNAANRMIRDQTMAEGSINRVDIHIRDIIKAALDLKATALIMVHNHPSGDPTPTQCDIDRTKTLISACRMFDIHLLEHLIVARSGVRGLREMGLIHYPGESR